MTIAAIGKVKYTLLWTAPREPTFNSRRRRTTSHGDMIATVEWIESNGRSRKETAAVSSPSWPGQEPRLKWMTETNDTPLSGRVERMPLMWPVLFFFFFFLFSSDVDNREMLKWINATILIALTVRCFCFLLSSWLFSLLLFAVHSDYRYLFIHIELSQSISTIPWPLSLSLSLNLNLHVSPISPRNAPRLVIIKTHERSTCHKTHRQTVVGQVNLSHRLQIDLKRVFLSHPGTDREQRRWMLSNKYLDFIRPSLETMV